jgi:hypothetical protein
LCQIGLVKMGFRSYCVGSDGVGLNKVRFNGFGLNRVRSDGVISCDWDKQGQVSRG